MPAVRKLRALVRFGSIARDEEFFELAPRAARLVAEGIAAYTEPDAPHPPPDNPADGEDADGPDPSETDPEALTGDGAPRETDPLDGIIGDRA